MKKLASILIVIMLLSSILSGFTAVAAEKIEFPFDEKTAKEFMLNGDLEKVSSDTGMPTNWKLKTSGSTADDFTLDNRPKSGKISLALTDNSGDGIFTSQYFYGVCGNAEYKIHVAVKPITAPPELKFEFYSTSPEGALVSVGAHTEKWKDKPDGRWHDWEFTIVTPAECTYGSFLLRNENGSGTVVFDDISMRGADASKYVKEVDISLLPEVNKIEPVAGSENLAAFGDMETAEGDGPKGWKPYKNSWDNDFISLSSENTHSGKVSACVTTDSGGNPWVNYRIPVEPDTEYQISTFVNVPYLGTGGVAYKFEYYTSTTEFTAETSIGGEDSSYLTMATGTHWYELVRRTTTPAGCVGMVIYCRLYGTGTVYFDDMTIYKTSLPKQFYLDTDDLFYYTESNHGVATARINELSYEGLEKGSFNFALMDGETVLYEQKNVPVTAGPAYRYEQRTIYTDKHTARFTFYMDDMREKAKEYTIRATYVDANGKEQETLTCPVYKYDRPTLMNEKGQFLVDGKPLNPIFAYHLKEVNFEAAKEAGINVVQGNMFPNPDGYVKQLDAAEKAGIKLIVCLYNEMKPAGSAANREASIAKIKAVKDHPALFAYGVMDEPFYHDKGAHQNLIDSYKLIRSLDSAHPVWIMEDANAYSESAKYCDIMGIDPYYNSPNDKDGLRVSYPSFRNTQAQQASDYKKPIWHLTQAYYYRGEFPTPEIMVNILYQAFMDGSMGVGYYEMDESYENKPLHETDRWPRLVAWYENESDLVFDFFVNEKYPAFLEVQNEDYRAVGFVKDGDLYLIALAKKEKETPVSIPLTSFGGEITVGDFTAVQISGTGTVSGNGTFELTLAPNEAVMYKITSDTKIDASTLAPLSFHDMYNYAWARTEAETLAAKGVVKGITERMYGPQLNVNRSDFAAALIRALGLTADGGDQFADVNSAADTAKELAVGKTLGILKGTGDGTYRPDAAITRQDMMVICARGLRQAGKLAEADAATLNAFSDTGDIAEYARADIADMVAAGLVKGNADGTINPLGNTTRAELAALISRIAAY